MTLHAAVDLGATSGRVVLGNVGPRRLQLTELHRFANGPVELNGSLHWDAVGLFQHVVTGLERLPRDVVSLGVDSWAIDYGLLDEHGSLLGVPYSYRDRRTDTVIDKVHAMMTSEQLHARHGLQFLPFTTLYQLAAAQGTAILDAARTLLLIPDLIGYWLTGVVAAEATNASTTGLFDAHRLTWSHELAGVAGIDPAILPPLHQPGYVLGPLRRSLRDQTRFEGQVVAVGSHDTASAFVATPFTSRRSVCISLGTWGLVGLETDAPVLSERSRDANFTNELGVDGRNRLLRNVAGLFLLTETLNQWRFTNVDRERLLSQAADLARGPVFDVDDPRLATPGGMATKIAEVMKEGGWRPPRRKAELVRAILDSLATKLAAAVHEAGNLAGLAPDVIHVVGGGVNNPLLCQLLANEAQLPVVAGPVEATALGNVLVQARAHNTLAGDLEELRALVRATQDLRRLEPHS
jgi:rhamnulokinase